MVVASGATLPWSRRWGLRGASCMPHGTAPSTASTRARTRRSILFWPCRCFFACSPRAAAVALSRPHVAAGLLLEGVVCAHAACGGWSACTQPGCCRRHGALRRTALQCPDWPVRKQAPQSLDEHELGRMEVRRMPLIVVAVAVLAALAPCSAQNTPCALLRGALARSLNPQP